MEQGIVAPGAVARGSARVATREEQARIGGAEAARAGSKVSSVDDVGIQSLRTVSTVANAPMMAEGLGLMGGGLLAWLAGKLNWMNVRLRIQSVTSAPFKALRETRWNNLGAFKAHYASAMHELANDALKIATERGKTDGIAIAEGWAKKASERAAALAHTIKPVEQAAHVASNAGSASGVVGGIMQWRAGRHAAAHTKHYERALAALTEKPPGFFEGMLQSLKLKSPVPATTHAGLSEVAQGLNSAKGLSGAALATHMEGVTKNLKTLVATGTNPELSAQAAHVLRFATKANNAANASHGWMAAAQQGLSGLGNTLMKAGGRMSVFGTLVAVGTTATIGATWLTLKKKHREDGDVLKQLAADIGDVNNPYFKQLTKASGKHTLANVGTTGLSTFGEVASGLTIAASQQAAMGGGMIAASMLPMMLGEPVKDNPGLSAYQALGRSDLNKEQRAEAIKFMVAIKPDVAAKGGIYNRLNAQVAHEMVARDMSRTQIVRLLADDTAFNKFATEVSAKHQAMVGKQTVVAGKAEAANDAVAHTAGQQTVVAGKGDAANDASMTKVEAAYHAAEKPQLQVTGADKQPVGRIETQSLRRA